MGLGKRLQGIIEPVKVVTQKRNFGLGYEPTAKELRGSEKKSKGEIKPYRKTLNGYFVIE